MTKVLIGIYGDNGHQITQQLHKDYPYAEIIAAAGCVNTKFAENVIIYDTLEEMLQNKDIQLVSLCSPVRAEQAKHAVMCMRAGKNVYAEKPCAFTEEELDEIIKTAHETGCKFHEMANVTYKDIYESLVQLVRKGALGEVIQISTQKSYTPNLEVRPQDEDIDGGLLLQVGIYNMRFAEQITGKKVINVKALQTKNGNPKDGELHTAVSFLTEHEDGVIGVGISNYCNPSGTYGTHGNECIRVFGTKGFAEITDYGKHRRLCTHEKDYGEFPITVKTRHYTFDVIEELAGLVTIDEPIEKELHPVRMAIRARNALKGGGV